METLNINSILIANRGEIASRVIRTCQKMGIRSIAVFSDADKDLPYVKEANLAVHIGASDPTASYLDQDKIIQTAIRHGADAIHPGYGFLSENAAFAEKCQAHKLIFIGPNPAAIKAMGSKSEAKRLMQANKVPTIPGYQGDDQSPEKLEAEAAKIGYPVLLKAAAGGGGKGMRIVEQASEMGAAIQAAKRESLNAFGDKELLIEKYIAQGRHIEFQIFGDQNGKVIHILERECTIQRRYQKVIEESPSPIMTESLRNAMGAAAIAAAKALDYDNAGTVEFIYDERSGKYFFLEVNTRLQVEHPVTEAITGLDLVQMQIESAQGLPLALNQEDIQGKGYAIEARLYAEDATNQFLPVSGKILHFQFPEVEGLRVETAVASGSEVSIYYDPMLAKIILWDHNRASALRKMRFVLNHLVCHGIITNQDFLQLLLRNRLFQEGKYDTHFIEQHLDLSELEQTVGIHLHTALIATQLFRWQQRRSRSNLLKNVPSGWRNNFYISQQENYQFGDTSYRVDYQLNNGQFQITIEELSYHAKIVTATSEQIIIELDGARSQFFISQAGAQYFIQNERFGSIQLQVLDRFPSKESVQEKGTYLSPMPSQVVQVLVKAGDEVQEGDPLVILSSMKMENQIAAAEAGIVEEVYVTAQTNIEAGVTLLKLKPN